MQEPFWKTPTITFQFIRFRLQNGFESLLHWIMFKYRSNEAAFSFMPLELCLWLISGQSYMQLFHLSIQNVIFRRLRFIFKAIILQKYTFPIIYIYNFQVIKHLPKTIWILYMVVFYLSAYSNSIKYALHKKHITKP